MNQILRMFLMVFLALAAGWDMGTGYKRRKPLLLGAGVAMFGASQVLAWTMPS